MTGTFFVSHQFTDYAAVQSLYTEGNEIATHSVRYVIRSLPKIGLLVALELSSMAMQNNKQGP